MSADINTLVETITPAMAKKLLEKNTHNRKVDAQQLAGLIREIKAGRFVANGDAIRLAKDGTILDGQHRLKACLVANKPIQAIILTGLDTDTQYTMDSGVKRSLASQLTILGCKNSSAVASAIPNEIGRSKTTIENMSANNYKIQISEGVDYYRTHPEIVEYVKLCNRLAGDVKLLPMMIIALLFKEFEKASTYEDAIGFFKVLRDGTGLSPDDAITCLRSRLIDDKNKLKVNKLNRKTKVVLTIKAWNKYIQGEKCQNLVYRPGGARPEAFPPICDCCGNAVD